MGLGSSAQAEANRLFWTAVRHEKSLARVSHAKRGGRSPSAPAQNQPAWILAAAREGIKAPMANTAHPQRDFGRGARGVAGQERRKERQ